MAKGRSASIYFLIVGLEGKKSTGSTVGRRKPVSA
jgi:hypothetical protein